MTAITLVMEPAGCGELQRLIQGRMEVRLLRRHDSQPDRWIVVMGCASQEIAARTEDRWN